MSAQRVTSFGIGSNRPKGWATDVVDGPGAALCGNCACRRLRLLGVQVTEAPTPVGVLGYYDPDSRQVVVRPGLSWRSRRSTIAHELAHVEMGDSSEPTWWSQENSDRVEDAADEIAARDLLRSLAALTDVLAWASDVDQVADAMGVDTDTVLARMRTLTDNERRYVDRRLAPPEADAC